MKDRSEAARAMGSVKSERKTEAARANGSQRPAANFDTGIAGEDGSQWKTSIA